MSPARRNVAPRKRPETLPEPTQLGYSGREAAAQDGEKIDGAATNRFDLNEAKRELLDDFNAALREGSGNAEGNSELGAHFEAALSALTEKDALRPVSASELKSTLQESFRISSAGGDTVEFAEQGRLLDDALGSLERRETRIALEFSQKVQSDGTELALQWLQEQLSTKPGADADDQGAPQVPVNVSTSSDTVKSRSRRLRGPPQKN